MKRLLQLLSDEELRKLCLPLGKKETIERYTRAFLIEKIQRSMGLEEILRNKQISQLLLDKIDRALHFIEASVGRLDRDDLIKICKQLGKEEIVKENMKKSQIVRTIFANLSILELLKSKHLQERLKPKYLSISDFKSLRKEIESLKADIDHLSSDLGFVSQRISTMNYDLKDLSVRLKSVENLFSVEASPDLLAYLRAFYEEALSIEDKLTPESMRDVSQRLQKKLGIDQRTFILKGIELLLTHYLLTQTKFLLWKPAPEDFMKILKEEFEKIKIAGEQAEIPKLRSRVTKRMSISDEMFDQMLIEAWKEDRVKLDVGAPIGEYDVKYLITEDGNKFYYVKLKS
jgi:hypothetical protein